MPGRMSDAISVPRWCRLTQLRSVVDALRIEQRSSTRAKGVPRHRTGHPWIEIAHGNGAGGPRSSFPCHPHPAHP